MSRVTYSVVSDAVFYDREAEIALLEQLLRTCGAAEIEVARACRQAIQDLESPTETIGRFKAIRGDHPDDRGDSEFSVPVEEFDPRQRLDSIWKDLNRDTRQLLGAAKRTTDLFEGRRVGFAAAAVAVLVGSAM